VLRRSFDEDHGLAPVGPGGLAMANLNRVFLIGRLTQDPELRYTAGGSAVTDLRLAINRTYPGKDGEMKEETLFIDVTVWNRQAENCCQYLKKGRQVHVEGYLKMDTWDDRNTGEKRSKVKVEADRVQFLDSKRDDAGTGDDYGGGSAPARRPAAPESRAPSNGPSRGPAPASPARRPADPEPEEADEDIPF
jgi:single-strand DNA-binding protein